MGVSHTEGGAEITVSGQNRQITGNGSADDPLCLSFEKQSVRAFRFVTEKSS